MPLSTDLLIDSGRLVAPRENYGLLIEPEPGLIFRAIGAVNGLREAAVLDRSVADLRESLLRRLGLNGPVIATGHQVEFFHAGVFAKIIAGQHLARRAAGGPLVYLAVDTDVPKTDRLPVPQVTAAGVRRVEVTLPGLDARLPICRQPAMPRAHWLDFFTRVADLTPGYEQSLLRPFIPGWLDGPPGSADFTAAMECGQAAAERALGLDDSLTLRMSELARGPEFRAFAAHLLLNARPFAEEYNRARDDYRLRNRERNPARPVPPLALTPERVELPLWLASRDGPRRRLSVRERHDAFELFANDEAVGALPREHLARADRAGAPWPIEADGWEVWPRALTLSAFVRLFVSDLFIHGIGGARYDEMTEDFIRRFYGVSLPPMACISATLLLNLPRAGVLPEELGAARRASRDIRFNPQRCLTNLPDTLLRCKDELTRRSRTLRAEQPHDHAARKMVFDELRRVNEQMLRPAAWRPAELDERVQTLEEQQRLDRAAMNREYFYALHSVAAMRTLAERLRAALRA
jgi:hypothetical protein